MDTFASSIATTLVALAFVLGLAWVSLRVLKRLQQGRGVEGGAPGASVPRFVRALPVGARERLVIVHYRGHEWMLGVTAGGISVLAREPIETPPAGQA